MSCHWDKGGRLCLPVKYFCQNYFQRPSKIWRLNTKVSSLQYHSVPNLLLKVLATAWMILNHLLECVRILVLSMVISDLMEHLKMESSGRLWGHWECCSPRSFYFRVWWWPFAPIRTAVIVIDLRSSPRLSQSCHHSLNAQNGELSKHLHSVWLTCCVHPIEAMRSRSTWGLRSTFRFLALKRFFYGLWSLDSLSHLTSSCPGSSWTALWSLFSVSPFTLMLNQLHLLPLLNRVFNKLRGRY